MDVRLVRCIDPQQPFHDLTSIFVCCQMCVRCNVHAVHTLVLDRLTKEEMNCHTVRAFSNTCTASCQKLLQKDSLTDFADQNSS